MVNMTAEGEPLKTQLNSLKRRKVQSREFGYGPDHASGCWQKKEKGRETKGSRWPNETKEKPEESGTRRIGGTAIVGGKRNKEERRGDTPD